MDFHKILLYVVTGCLLVVDPVSAYFNQTYGDITFILSDVNADNSLGQPSLKAAQNWCESNGYTLAKIPDERVQNYVQQFINSALNSVMITNKDLIILNGKLNTGLPGTWRWVNGQQRNDINIQDQRDLSQGYFYGYLKTTDFKIHVSSHNSGRPYICEKPGSDNDCAGGQSLNGRCYQRKTNSLTWYSARNDCVKEGGDLASFETLSDNTFNSTLGSTLLANASSTEYWVGMQRVEWRWEDNGLPIKYTKWEDGSPSNADDCLCLRRTTTLEWLWYNYGCSQTYRFICMATNRTTLVPTIPTSSTTAEIDASSTKSTSGSVIPAPTSPSFSVQPTSNSSASYNIPITNDSRLALGLGIGLGVGTIVLIIAIVLAVIFMRRKQNRKQNDARREVNATLPQTSALSSTSETSRKPNKNSSPINGMQLGRTTGDRTQTYETLQSADGRSPESPYQQLDLYETPN